MTDDKPRLDDFAIAARAAKDLMPGMVVNLGVGLPLLVSNFIEPESEILLHSENGILGFGSVIDDPYAADPHCINAGGQPVARVAGMSFMSHDQSFELVRGGWIDVTMLGAIEVGANGDLANFWLPGRLTGSLGGAQDLATCAKALVVLMRHQDKGGKPKLVNHVSLPITAPRCVKRVITDIAVIDFTPSGLVLRELLPGWTAEEIQAVTEPSLIVPCDIEELTL
jgi:3-oxoacid CoA-transferase subunit B